MPKKTKVMKKVMKKTSKIEPLADRVLVRPLSLDELAGKTNNFGIIIPDTVSKEKSAHGKVLAVGEGRMVDGVRVPMSIKVGDTVIFSKYAYDEVEQNGEELYILKEDSILAIVK